MMGIFFSSALKYLYVLTKSHLSDVIIAYQQQPESELHSAARQCKFTLLRSLLKQQEWGLATNSTNCRQETPLHLVSAQGDTDCVQLLFEYGADSTLCDSSGMTALHKACTEGHNAVVDLIFKYQGCGSINIKDAWGWTPLQRALLNYHYQTAAILLEHGCAINLSDEKGRTALHVVASYGHVRTVSMLISKGANVNCRDKKGWTPLMLAILGGHVQVVRDLIHNGCDVNIKNHNDATALVLCCRSMNKYACAYELINAGANCSNIDPILEEFLSKCATRSAVYDNSVLCYSLVRLLVISMSKMRDTLYKKAVTEFNRQDQESDASYNHILRLFTVAGSLNQLKSHTCPKLKDISRCVTREFISKAQGNVTFALKSTKELPFGLRELLLLNDV